VTVSKKEMQEDGTEVVKQQAYTTLVINWGTEVRSVDASVGKEADGDHLTDLQRASLIKLAILINKEGAEIPPGLGAPEGLHGVTIGPWYEHLGRARVLGDRGQSEANFKKLVTALQAKRQIEVSDPWVWIPLDPKAGGQLCAGIWAQYVPEK
jgi:hypothetical protein